MGNDWHGVRHVVSQEATLVSALSSCLLEPGNKDFFLKKIGVNREEHIPTKLLVSRSTNRVISNQIISNHYYHTVTY
jgi:hypothetical protein